MEKAHGDSDCGRETGKEDEEVVGTAAEFKQREGGGGVQMPVLSEVRLSSPSKEEDGAISPSDCEYEDITMTIAKAVDSAASDKKGDEALVEEEEGNISQVDEALSDHESNNGKTTLPPVNNISTTSVKPTCLNPKMRLKKQRLLESLQEKEETEAMQIDDPSLGVACVLVAMKKGSMDNQDVSGLHRLAEAAENRKQQEEGTGVMMEVDTVVENNVETSTSLQPPPLRQQSIQGPVLFLGPGQRQTTAIPSASVHNTLPRAESSNEDEDEEVATCPAASVVRLSVARNQQFNTPSPDSANHSTFYSPSHSPVQSRHTVSGFSSPFSLRTTPSLSRNNSDASQYSTSSPLSPSSHSLISPSHSPIQNRHHLSHTHSYPPSPHQASRHLPYPGGIAGPFKNAAGETMLVLSKHSSPMKDVIESGSEKDSGVAGDGLESLASCRISQSPGISRQQLINSPCPICGDKISGFHYGIFSCESCKGFFKRTVQNKKNYVCVRGGQCPVSTATRKKCPACRFDKCLRTGMKLEAIREDRTRGGRSTYQCSYTLPAGLCSSQPPSSAPETPAAALPPPPSLPSISMTPMQGVTTPCSAPASLNQELPPAVLLATDSKTSRSSRLESLPLTQSNGDDKIRSHIPQLLQEIMDVEHLWFSSKPLDGMSKVSAKNLLPDPSKVERERADDAVSDTKVKDVVQTLTVMADKRLYKLVKWCKSLPLFKNILVDDQISLLINAWCELLVFSCCFRSVHCSPGVIKVSNEKMLDLELAKKYGIEKCIEKMLNFTNQIRRLRVDYYEYVSMKVIVLLTSDASGLKRPDQVRDSQEKVVQSLQQYTTANYPDMTSKFGELLLRIPELQRVCQVGKEMLCPRQSDDTDGPPFNLLMELLRGDH